MVKFKKPSENPKKENKKPQKGFTPKHNEHLRNEASFRGHMNQTVAPHVFKTPKGNKS